MDLRVDRKSPVIDEQSQRDQGAIETFFFRVTTFGEGVPLGAAFDVGVGEIKEEELSFIPKEPRARLKERRFNCALGAIERIGDLIDLVLVELG